MLRAMEWKVLPHGDLVQLEENLWSVTGEFDIPFNPLKRVMTIARREDGTLVLHGLMALDDVRQKQVEALGEIKYLIAPSGYHRLDAGRYRERYPNAKLYAPAASRARVEKIAKVDGAYADFPNDDTTELASVDGLADREGALVVKSKNGVTYVMNDALFNMPHETGLSGFVLRNVTQSTGGPKVSRTARIALIADKARYANALRAIADVPSLKRVMVAHHVPIEGDVPGALRAVADTL